METTFARIMASFEAKWDQFIDEKGFQGFMDEYHGRWLHSCVHPLSQVFKISLMGFRNQQVTLTTVEPHQKLLIKGITSDQGLLRCVPVSGLASLHDRSDYGDDDRTTKPYNGKKAEESFVDLQPDGNSFDMMSGLIKRKVM